VHCRAGDFNLPGAENRLIAGQRPGYAESAEKVTFMSTTKETV